VTETIPTPEAAPEPIACLPSLFEALAAVPDFRRGQGRRYPLASILAFGVVATLCGYKSYGAMQEWGKNYGDDLAKALGFSRGRVPSVGTLFTVFSRVDKTALEQAINTWAERVLATLPGEAVALAGDGKALRGSHARGATDTFLLSVVSQRLGLTLMQQAVPDATNEIGAMPQMLCALVLEGRVLTLDAAHTQKTTAQSIVQKGAITS
jgi:DDE_Tnp_1-associated